MDIPALALCPCANHPHGCAYTGPDSKCLKHEWFFCQECGICNTAVPPGSVLSHYAASHGDVTQVCGAARPVTPGTHSGLVATAAGVVVVQYALDDTMLLLYVHSNVASERLSEYCCTVLVSEPGSGYTRTFTPKIEYLYVNDWLVRLNKHECPSWSTLFEVSVDISKVDL